MPLGVLDYNGRPFGMGLIAKSGQEGLMLQFMSAFEAFFPKRKVPPQLVHMHANQSNGHVRFVQDEHALRT